VPGVGSGTGTFTGTFTGGGGKTLSFRTGSLSAVCTMLTALHRLYTGKNPTFGYDGNPALMDRVA
jgi:hypothetical protein